MHKHYIINNIVEFHPAASTLRDINNPDRVVVLNSPAGRCLLLLIDRAGSIVTQQEFLDIVWQSRGMLVSPNTYYQNISILRKGLKKIGFETDPIVTIPRIGLTLASDTQIVIREPLPGAAPAADEKCPEVLEPEEPSAPSLEAAEPAAPVSVKPTRWPAVVLGMLLIILAGAGVTGYMSATENRFVEDYHFAASIGACRVYLANDIQTQNERASALAYVEPFKADCAQYPWVYISWYALLPRASVIRCDRPMKEPNRCISDYFLKDS
ncbi:MULTISPECIES: winged helix-turn-helix domain-containing protein [Enterobacter cloacae complex]|uniref:Winged helix-turn-helix domain-containing protein n=1 Tax=Enterobacter cloacae TaxID=550 RepID=A0A7H8UBY9_ENTCL|nr:MULTISPECIES: winged helix-turn-helix domain-containing protein [Enterobacter cloacae complex]MDE4080951.1 winged helix-turn-helix domain-containing protein [Enterobacter pasteurii]QKZ97014.1 winged helix-turn-helix domain-containing protein [Enterobacter cloacae]